MAIQQRHRKEKTRTPRPSRNRREYSIQELTEQEVQVIEAVLIGIQETLDSNGDSSAKWPGGSIRANLCIRFGEGIGAVHYPLPKGVLPSGWLQSLRLAAEHGCIRKGNGADKSTGTTDGSGRLSGDAGADANQRLRNLTTRCETAIRSIRTELREFGRDVGSVHESCIRRKAKTDRKRRGIYARGRSNY